MATATTTLDTPYRVTYDKDEIVIRTSRSLFSRDDLSHLLDYLQFHALRHQVQLDNDEISTLADEITSAAWERIKHNFLAELE